MKRNVIIALSGFVVLVLLGVILLRTKVSTVSSSSALEDGFQAVLITNLDPVEGFTVRSIKIRDFDSFKENNTYVGFVLPPGQIEAFVAQLAKSQGLKDKNAKTDLLVEQLVPGKQRVILSIRSEGAFNQYCYIATADAVKPLWSARRHMGMTSKIIYQR